MTQWPKKPGVTKELQHTTKRTHSHSDQIYWSTAHLKIWTQSKRCSRSLSDKSSYFRRVLNLKNTMYLWPLIVSLPILGEDIWGVSELVGQERPINIPPARPIRQLAGPLVRCRNAPDWISFTNWKRISFRNLIKDFLQNQISWRPQCPGLWKFLCFD